MARTVTRQELASAILRILEVNGVPDPEDAVEVLGSPGNGIHLFVLIPSERAQVALGEDLMGITGRRHPPAADVWILDEEQNLALIRVAEDQEVPNARPDTV